MIQVLERYESGSTPGLWYEVSWTGSSYKCNCPGFKFSKKKPRTCCHVTSYSEVHDPPEVVKTGFQLNMAAEIESQWEYIMQRKHRRHW